MNKIKIPKNWVLKYFEVEGNTTKFVYEDQLRKEHIFYINEKPEPELPTYEELQERIDKAIEYINTHSEMTDIQLYGIENVLAFRGSVDKLLDILKGDNK